MDAIAKTSLLTAAMRAVETKRSDEQGRLFSDPYAELLAGEEGADLLKRAIAASGDQPAIAVRTYFIDQKIKEALQKGLRQIVMLAAGMDTRAYRFSFPQGTCVFELDRPEVLSYKQEKLKDVQPQCERKALTVDLRDEWQSPLIKAGFNKSQRTLWLVEGLLMYLEEADVLALLKKISSLSSTDDIMLLDVLSRTLLEAPYMKAQTDFLKSLGATWHFGVNDPVKFFEAAGWKATLTQPGDFAPTRWPFPTVPLNVPNVPRGYYVEARRV